MSTRRNTRGKAERRTERRGGQTEITARDGDLATANAFTERQYFKITDSAGVVKHYVITNSHGGGVATGTAMNSSSDVGLNGALGSAIANLGTCIAVQVALSIGGPVNQATVLNELREAINHSNGHNAGAANSNISISAALSAANGPQTMTFSNASLTAVNNVVITKEDDKLWQFDIKGKPSHGKTLFSDKQKSVVNPDFTFGHYEAESTTSNYDLHSKGDFLGGKAYIQFRIGGSTGNNTVHIEDAAGKQVVFYITDESSRFDGTMAGGRVLVGTDGAGSTSAVATRFAGAINASMSAAGHTFKALAAGTTVIIKQRISGPSGNTTFTNNATNTTVTNSSGGAITAFTGGETTAQAPFSSRFQLVRTPEVSGQSVRLNNYKTQG